MNNKWKCYQSAIIPMNPETPMTRTLTYKQIYNQANDTNPITGKIFFAQYVSQFDVGKETDWWYTIKDGSYDIISLNANRRYKITKARKNFSVKKVNPLEYRNELFEILKLAYTGYSELERPEHINFLDFENEIKAFPSMTFYIAEYIPEKKYAGFIRMNGRGGVLDLVQLKTIPAYEKYGVNAALVDYVLTEFSNQLEKKKLIVSNGSRNIRHITHFNEYLEKYFGFRKAYCVLEMKYPFYMKIAVYLLSPFKYLFYFIGTKLNKKFLYDIYCVLKMNSIAIKTHKQVNK